MRILYINGSKFSWSLANAIEVFHAPNIHNSGEELFQVKIECRSRLNTNDALPSSSFWNDGLFSVAVLLCTTIRQTRGKNQTRQFRRLLLLRLFIQSQWSLHGAELKKDLLLQFDDLIGFVSMPCRHHKCDAVFCVALYAFPKWIWTDWREIVVGTRSNLEKSKTFYGEESFAA